MIQKLFLIVCRRPPYGESFARAALDTAMAAAAFDQKVMILFFGDGVTQLLKHQDSSAIAQKSLEKQLSALPLYDVNEIYVDAAALYERGIDASDLSLTATPLNSKDIAALLARSDIALNF
jgi:tRNA 2-thiouridine synthesizing protein C